MQIPRKPGDRQTDQFADPETGRVQQLDQRGDAAPPGTIAAARLEIQPGARRHVGGDIGAIDLVGTGYRSVIRELVVNASDQDHADAQFNMGVLYAYGRGVNQDFAEALSWFEKADANGSPQAKENADYLRTLVP